MLHVVGVAVPPNEPGQLLVLLLKSLRRDLRLLQQRLPLQLQERHVQVGVQYLGGGGDWGYGRHSCGPLIDHSTDYWLRNNGNAGQLE